MVVSTTPRFGPACEGERIVFGARMPGYGSRSIPLSVVRKWILFLRAHGVERMCCLLAQSQLGYYEDDLLATAGGELGIDNVHWSPIEDYHLCSSAASLIIIDFLEESDKKGRPVVVHCAGGRGRTGLVLAAWLVFGRGLAAKEALSTVQGMGRDPYEAVKAGNATEEDLFRLLNSAGG